VAVVSAECGENTNTANTLAVAFCFWPSIPLVAREVLQLAVRRLSPGDHFVGDAAAEITVLRQVADKVPMADARTEILKAVAVLRDRV
jgi:hypothetical protein